MITKGAQDVQHHHRVFEPTSSARDAIYRFISRMDLGRPPRVLVPAYYGWSSLEGSGVMDPLQRAGAVVELIRVSRSLHVDLDHFRRSLKRTVPDVVLPIHYFGWTDPEVGTLISECRESGALVLEDEAHSMLACLLGRTPHAPGDASALSLHKTLPVSTGGILIDRRVNASHPLPQQVEGCVAMDYDLPAIAATRRRNAQMILDEITEAGPSVQPLRRTVPDTVVPLNVPVLVPPDRRQNVYTELNRSGYGVVSLYHTLGPGIREDLHPDSFWLSARLINLPCHQDVDEAQIPSMVAALRKVVEAT